jgi:DNA-binding CsgD family transcriptional regulator
MDFTLPGADTHACSLRDAVTSCDSPRAQGITKEWRGSARIDAGVPSADHDIGSALATLLDTLDLGVLLLAPGGRLLVANDTGRRLLRMGQPLAVVDGAVKPARQADVPGWTRALVASASGVVQTINLDAAHGAQSISICAVFDPGAGPAGPLGGREIEPGGHDHKYGIYFGPGPGSVPARVRAVCGIYALTPSEGRVLLSLANDEPPKTVARALGLSESTVRSHLTQIRAKLGANSIRTVTARVARMPPCHAESGTRKSQQDGRLALRST